MAWGNITADGLFADVIDEGQVFRLKGAKLGPVVNTAHGETQTALLQVDTPNKPDAWLSIIGTAIVNQVRQLEPSDTPAWCIIERQRTKADNPVKVLRPAVKGQDMILAEPRPIPERAEPSGGGSWSAATAEATPAPDGGDDF